MSGLQTLPSDSEFLILFHEWISIYDKIKTYILSCETEKDEQIISAHLCLLNAHIKILKNKFKNIENLNLQTLHAIELLESDMKKNS